MSSPQGKAVAAPIDGFRTPPTKAAASEEDEEKASFAEYGLSSPPLRRQGRQPFKEAVAKIMIDYAGKWENGSKAEKKILLFLYSRGVFYGEEQSRPIRKSVFGRFLNFLNGFYRPSEEQSQPDRKDALDRFLVGGHVRKRMMLVIDAEGDTDVSSTKSEHYAITCMAIHRYFEQEGARGFLSDMSTLMVYLRNQKYGGCFFQSPCVCTSYLLQSHGKDLPPPDASRFIRHNFTDDHLFKYIVEDDGGDSLAVYELLEKQFFDSDAPSHPMNTVCARSLRNPSFVETLKDWIREGPGLVSIFPCKKFYVRREAVDRKCGGYALRCGYARFTEWGQPAEFVHLQNPSDEEAKQKQKKLFKKWKDLCKDLAINVNTSDLPDDVTLATVRTTTSSMSLDESSDRESRASSDSERESDSFTEEGIGDSDAESDRSDEDEDDALHSMIIIGFREVNGDTFWLLQNSWSQMRLIEMSTQYLAMSGAQITVIDRDTRRVREKARSPILCSPARVAESHQIERADCGRWDERAIYPPDRKGEDATWSGQVRRVAPTVLHY